jgi:hypothetical protein
MQRAGLQQHEWARGGKQQQRDLDWLRWGLLDGVLRAGRRRVVGTCADGDEDHAGPPRGD